MTLLHKLWFIPKIKCQCVNKINVLIMMAVLVVVVVSKINYNKTIMISRTILIMMMIVTIMVTMIVTMLCPSHSSPKFWIPDYGFQIPTWFAESGSDRTRHQRLGMCQLATLNGQDEGLKSEGQQPPFWTVLTLDGRYDLPWIRPLVTHEKPLASL